MQINKDICIHYILFNKFFDKLEINLFTIHLTYRMNKNGSCERNFTNNNHKNSMTFFINPEWHVFKAILISYNNNNFVLYSMFVIEIIKIMKNSTFTF